MPFSAEEEHQIYLKWCNNDEQAVKFLHDISEISQIADDFVDGDVSDSESMTRLLHLSLVSIPTNPFFLCHANWLVPIMSSSMLLWNASNGWKNEFGFVYREALEQIVGIVAGIVGGHEHAIQVTKELNEFYHQTHGEGYDNWLKEVES
tara:strand:+ start:221 stop:667 length:447 start_codon:yes stop_codon:yes gene_type:complete